MSLIDLAISGFFLIFLVSLVLLVVVVLAVKNNKHQSPTQLDTDMTEA